MPEVPETASSEQQLRWGPLRQERQGPEIILVNRRGDGYLTSAYAAAVYVLHPQWGVGRIVTPHARQTGPINVRFGRTVRSVDSQSVRRLLTKTDLAKWAAANAPNITSWMVRKADEQGVIQPDAKGHCAGHKVHYYDPARIPSLLAKLTATDPWPVGVLTFHEEYGAGRVAPRDIRQGDPTDALRTVRFFSTGETMTVPAGELHRLLPVTAVARRLGIQRKALSSMIRRRGIAPDYVTPEGRTRDFYDERRLEAIRERLVGKRDANGLSTGNLAVDAQGDVWQVQDVDGEGRILVRPLEGGQGAETFPVNALRKLVSTRELARQEGMSRYKLNRLLKCAGFGPGFRRGQTVYFDQEKAHEILRARLGLETTAICLPTVARRTGISEAVLAAKARAGRLRTIGGAAYAVEAQEAQRVEALVTALASKEGLAALGICQWHQRGREGREIVGWDLERLAEVGAPMDEAGRQRLFDQVAWLCTGSGHKRFGEALDVYLRTSGPAISPQASRGRQAARVLAGALAGMPREFDTQRTALIFRAALTDEMCAAMDQRLRRLAHEIAGPARLPYDRLQGQVEALLSQLMFRMGKLAFDPTPPGGTGYPCDEFVRGAVIVSALDNVLELGLIVGVEQQSWNAIGNCWHKTVVAQFGDKERRVNPSAGTERGRCALQILLTARETEELATRIEKLRLDADNSGVEQ